MNYNQMKKRYQLLVVAVLLVTAVIAQPPTDRDASIFHLGILAGLNIPRLTGGGGNPLSEGWSSRSGNAYGLTSTLNIEGNLDLQLDALYSSEGGKRNGLQALDASSIDPNVPAGTYFYANFNNESILNYIEIPVMAKYKIPIGPSSKFYVEAGPYVGILLNARQKTSGSSLVYAHKTMITQVTPSPVPFDANTNVTSSINKENYGLTGGIGITQKAGFGDIFLAIRGAYGLTNIQKYKADGTSHTGNLLVAIGYIVPFSL